MILAVQNEKPDKLYLLVWERKRKLGQELALRPVFFTPTCLRLGCKCSHIISGAENKIGLSAADKRRVRNGKAVDTYFLNCSLLDPVAGFREVTADRKRYFWSDTRKLW